MYYDAIVVSSDSDSSDARVRVKILGLTDSLPDIDQPWAVPSGGSTSNTPQEGTYLKVVIDEADKLLIEYFLVGPGTNTFLSDEYLSDSENLEVTDLGAVFIYNRSNASFTEYMRASQYKRVVTDSGDTEISTPYGYSYNSKQESIPNTGVVTEDCVNLMTGRPIGQGSRTYKVPTFKNKPATAGTFGDVEVEI
jgi:hypothetical protein